MLKLNEIVKDYYVAENVVRALKGVSFEFRKSEFVAILGPSGCGKTTLLNIIGGLDRYTSGDLVINGRSTKDYKDKDWDKYRNNTVGFVFQTYNLIPHQSVLGNVELALTLSGVSKQERKQRAIDALEKVGLGDQISKRPNQLSGGQMQRVAIARALVNNPDIILADEPTGALDTETSVQVMEILKEIAKEKLVIMVTHNPELANKYATRIIRLLDGLEKSDTNPYQSNIKAKAIEKEEKKVSMSFFTALTLSFRNLITKKARTFLTAFAGSIGIIGIALILSLSSGFQNYISNVERDTLSTYPLIVGRQNMDMSAIIEALNHSDEGKSHPTDEVIESNNILQTLLASSFKGIHNNDLQTFMAYLETPANKTEIEKYTSAIQYVYNVQLNIYKENEGSIQQLNPVNYDYITDPFLKMFLDSFSQMLEQMNFWEEILTNQSLMEKQYDLLKGSWPQSANDIVLIVDEYNQINDFALYALGLKDINELSNVLKGQEVPEFKVSFDDILNTKYKLLYQSDLYEAAPTAQNPYYYEDISKDTNAIATLIQNNSIDLNVSGIIRVKEGVSATALSGSIGYSNLLTKQIIEYNHASEVVTTQLAHQDKNVLTSDGSFGTGDLKTAYDTVLETIGYADLSNPSAIKLFPLNFESKDSIKKFIKDYNKNHDEKYEIRFSDMIGTMMSSVSTIINAITYVLIAFVSISLIVSSIMIGIITYISVLERTKEIGVLRSIGASKKDISRVFNAETLIVGFVAGALGIGITLLLNIPVNIIINALSGISGVAALPWQGAIILILISMLLSFVAGLLPSRIAAKKDPVVALRTE